MTCPLADRFADEAEWEPPPDHTVRRQHATASTESITNRVTQAAYTNRVTQAA
jgi:hypothetical protein